MTSPDPKLVETVALRVAAEKRIQRILLDLEEEAGSRIERVEVDTRNFENCRVEIWFAKGKSREGG